MSDIKRSVLFVGHAFYNAWYLSRELRKIGWEADLINIDTNPTSQKFYHGQDISFSYTRQDLLFRINIFVNALDKYSIFHFSNRGGIYFVKDINEPGRAKHIFPVLNRINKLFFSGKSLQGAIDVLISFRVIKRNKASHLQFTRSGFWFYRKILSKWLYATYGTHWDIELLKLAGKKIGYTNNGCLDGALQSSFAKWAPINTCAQLCKFYTQPQVCSDYLNAEWGRFRNRIADYQCNIGGNNVDYNDVSEVFESPWFYCLDPKFWNPDCLVPSNYILPFGKEIVKIYHSVGNFEGRSDAANKNIKCTHIYLDLIEKFKKEGLPVELIFFHDVPNKIIRFYQLQADIVVDMLTFGFFGANIREAMMLGKPAVCYLRPEWLDRMRKEIPDYVNELPVVSATPETIDEILRDLIANKEKREEIGRRSRDFAVKWHGSANAAKYFDQFLELILNDNMSKEKIFQIQEHLYN